MDAYQEVASLVRSEDAARRIAEFEEDHVRKLLTVALELLRDAQDVIALSPEGFNPPLV